MKKFLMLILSAVLCGATPVFGMELPEAEKYNEEYHKLPKKATDSSEPDSLDSWEDLGETMGASPASSQQNVLSDSWIKLDETNDASLVPEDLLRAQIFYSDSARQAAGFWELKKSWAGLGS